MQTWEKMADWTFDYEKIGFNGNNMERRITMSGKERLYAVTGAVELIEHEWRNRRRVWIGLAVLLVLLSHFYILVSLNRITRELDRLNNDNYEMKRNRTRLR